MMPMKHSQTIHHSWLHDKVEIPSSLKLEARLNPKFSSKMYKILNIFLFHIYISFIDVTRGKAHYVGHIIYL